MQRIYLVVKMSDSNYDASAIQVLKGLDAVKKRPGMYIGNTDDGSGLHQMIYEVLDNSIDEYLAGHCDEIHVLLNQDGSCTVSDNGRGIPIDMHKDENMPAAEVIMTQLHSGGKFNKDTYKISGGLHGVGISVVNALSEWLILTIKRNGYVYTMSFKDGIKVQDLTKGIMTSETGTEITFLPSNTTFSDIKFSFSILSKRLRELSYLNKVTIYFTDHKNNKKHIFKSNGGLIEFISEIDAKYDKIHESVILLQHEHLDIAMRWNVSSSDHILCFTNNIPQVDGGTHLSGLKSALTKIFTQIDKQLIGEDIREGLCCILSIRLFDPRFDSQTKSKLVSAEAKKFVESLVAEKLSIWLEENKNQADAIVQRIKLSAQAREAARKAREIVKRTNELDITSLPGKLSDCSAKNPHERELFIVEGDSAGGSAKQARDRRFQAILPLRGKVLNVEKAKFSKVISSEQIGTLISAIGAGIGKDFNPENARYHKMILMTDADIDGSHIRTLLLTFFFNYMYPLIEKGFLHIAQPPLYSIRKKNTLMYIKNDHALNKYLLSSGLQSLGCKISIDDHINVNYIQHALRDHIIDAICINSLQNVRNNPNLYFTLEQEKIIYNKHECSIEVIYNAALDNVDWCKYKNIMLNNQRISLINLLTLAESTARNGLDIQRFKGLGEMQAEQLWETTLNPANRILLQVCVNDFTVSKNTLEDLMGEFVEPRRTFIEQNALYVRNLDA